MLTLAKGGPERLHLVTSVVGCLPPPEETHWSMLIDEIRAQTLERPGLDLDATSTRPRPRHDPTRPRPRPEIQYGFH